MRFRSSLYPWTKGLLAAIACLLVTNALEAADRLINVDVQNHATPDANKPDLGNFPDFIPGENIWIGDGPDGVPSLKDFDGTDPVNLTDDLWNYVSLNDIKAADAAGDMDGFQDAPNALTDITGTPSSIAFEFTSPLASLAGGTRSDDLIMGFGFGFEADDVVRDEINNIPDIIGGTGLSTDWKLTGLDATGSTTYDIYVIAANIWSGGWTDIGLTHSGSATAEVKQLTAPNNGGNSPQYTGGALALGGQYQEYLGVTADGSGEISGFVRDFNDGGGKKFFSALQIVEHTASVALPGDFNGDGTVNGADYTVWRDNEGAADESSLNGNGSGDSAVDATDYALWVDNYGNSSSQATTVPEPSALLLAIGALGMLSRRR